MNYSDPRVLVCYARRVVESTLNCARNIRRHTEEEIAADVMEMEENRDEYDYLASLITVDEPQE